MEKMRNSLRSLITNKKRGSLIYPSDFHGLGTDSAIKQTLSRMARSGEISRLAHGIYYVPKQDPILGPMQPTVDEVLNMLIQKEKIKIKPAGASALHQLGLTTQVPTKRIYITDGSPRLLAIGKQQIRLKKTTPKKLARVGELSSLIIQALEELETDAIDKVTRARIKTLLRKENPTILKKDLSLAPKRINDYIVNLLKETTHD